MENDQTTAQVETPITQDESAQQTGGGIQKRIDELTARFHGEREANQKLQQQLVEQAQRQSELMERLATQNAPQQAAPVDPLAGFAEQVDPRTLEAMRSAMAATERQLKQQFAAQQAQLELQSSVHQLRYTAAATSGLPPEVAQRAEQLLMAWRQKGWKDPTPDDALDIALGQYQRGQLAKAAPVRGYVPTNLPTVTPGLPPPPRQTASRPANFDALSAREQNAYLEKSGALDEPL